MKAREQNKFELELEILKAKRKEAMQSDNKTKAKELGKFIRNLEAIVKLLRERE